MIEERHEEGVQNPNATNNTDSPEVEQLRKQVDLDEKIAELRKDETHRIMLDLGLEAEIREDPGILEGSARRIKFKEYADKALKNGGKVIPPVIPAPKEEPKKVETVQEVANQFVANAPAPVVAGEETYIPSELSVKELMAKGYTKEQAALARSFPH